MRDDLFDEIDKYKEDLPKFDKALDDVRKYEFNFYQKFAVFFEIICLFGGILLGNIFPSCQSSSMYSTKCIVTEFNVSITIITWFVGFIFSMFIFGLGHIIRILDEINKKIKKQIIV